MRKVSFGEFRTIHDVDDGFGGTTGSCREYALPRDHQDCEPYWVDQWTHQESVQFFKSKIECCLDQYGIEIQVPSTSRDGSNSWVVISGGDGESVLQALIDHTR